MKNGMLEAAIAQADDRAHREGRRMTVYLNQATATWFVRSDSEPWPEDAVTVYRTV